MRKKRLQIFEKTFRGVGKDRLYISGKTFRGVGKGQIQVPCRTNTDIMKDSHRCGGRADFKKDSELKGQMQMSGRQLRVRGRTATNVG